MPIKRRLPKGRAQLTAGQRAFLEGLSWPAPPEYYGNIDAPGWYQSHMQHCWLTQPHRYNGQMPDGSAIAKTLWAEYGAEAVKDWNARHPGEPHPALKRFSLPPG